MEKYFFREQVYNDALKPLLRDFSSSFYHASSIGINWQKLNSNILLFKAKCSKFDKIAKEKSRSEF